VRPNGRVAGADVSAVAPRIHVPPADLDEAEAPVPADEASPDGDVEAVPKRKRTRRGSRGGRGRKKKAAAVSPETPAGEAAG